MAIYYLNLKHGSRGNGQRAGAHSRYIQREEPYTYNADQVRHIESGNLPHWAKDATHFWDMADIHAQAHARLYSEFEIALPRELSTDAQVQLTKEFVSEVIGEKHPYTVVIHESPAIDGGTNPHLHCMFSARTMDGVARSEHLFFRRANSSAPERGGAPKDRGWIHRSRLEHVRATWEQCANRALKQAGVDAVIDRRTLAAQGIDRPPQPKLTSYESMLWKQGIETPVVKEILLLKEMAVVQAQEQALQEQRKILKAIERLVDIRTQAEAILVKEKTELKTLQLDRDTADRIVDKFTKELHESKKDHSGNVTVALSRVYGRALGIRREEVKNAVESVSRLREQIRDYGLEPGRVFLEVKQLTADFGAFINAHRELAKARENYQSLNGRISSPVAQEKLNTIAQSILEERAAFEADRNQALEDALTLRDTISLHLEVAKDLEDIIQGLNDDIHQELQKLSIPLQQWLTSEEQELEIGQEVKAAEDEAAKRRVQAQAMQHQLNFDFSFT